MVNLTLWLLDYNVSMNFSQDFGIDDDPGFILKYDLLTTVVLCLAYSTVFVLGLLGNGFVVAVVVRSPRMRSTTNLFIVNLACADLLINVLCLPFTLIANLIPAWILGSVICKGVAYFQGVSVSASINTLMAISIERCKAISSPLSGTMTCHSCRLIISIIWIFALCINLPWIIVFTLEPLGIMGSKAQICTELWPSRNIENLYFVLANVVVCYLLPLFVISACYVKIWRIVALRRMPGAICGQIVINRSKVKVVKMLFVVVVTFAVSWLPLYVLFCMIKFGNPSTWNGLNATIATLVPIAQWLGASNSCINPIIYAFFNRKFRAGFRAIITSKSCCGQLQYEKYNSCHYSHKDRIDGGDCQARKDKCNKNHFSIYNIDQKKKVMIRSKSVMYECRCLHGLGERSKSVNLFEEVEIPLRGTDIQNSTTVNAASKV